MLTRTTILDTQLPASSLIDTLRSAANYGDTHRLPDQLKSVVDTIRFEPCGEDEYRIVLVGQSSGGTRYPTISVEGRIKILPKSGPNGPAQMRLRVLPTSGSLLGISLAPCIFVVLAIVRLFQEFPSLGSFFLYLAFAALSLGLPVLSGRGRIAKAWPGLLAEAKRLATGSLYLPAA